MADVRLIVLVAVAACADAGAQTTPAPVRGVKPPAGWVVQPAIATAAKDALGKQVEAVEAFGEPAMGCYSVWMSLRSAGEAKDVAEQLVRGLAAEPAADKKSKQPPPRRKLEIADVVKPTAEEGVLALSFESPPYKGRLRARLGKGRIVALACWFSPREPLACEQACTTVLGALP